MKEKGGGEEKKDSYLFPWFSYFNGEIKRGKRKC
jgi:hypothetical protein